MDRLLTLGDVYPNDKLDKERVKENMIKLIDLYYYALDAPKKGGKKVEVPNDLKAELYPHYMEKESSYTSASILGQIYDKVHKYQQEDLSKKDITTLSCFDVELPEDVLKKWKSNYEQYRKDMGDMLKVCDFTSKSKAANDIYNKYKAELYGASELQDSPKTIKQLNNEALAIYRVTYDHAMLKNEVSRCGFAWKVAGSILLQFYASKQDPAVLWREIFGL